MSTLTYETRVFVRNEGDTKEGRGRGSLWSRDIGCPNSHALFFVGAALGFAWLFTHPPHLIRLNPLPMTGLTRDLGHNLESESYGVISCETTRKVFSLIKWDSKGSLSLLLQDIVVVPCAAWNSGSHLVTMRKTKFSKATVAEMRPALWWHLLNHPRNARISYQWH